MATIGSLRVDLAAESAAFRRDLNRARDTVRQSARGMTTALDRATASFGRMERSAARARSVVAGLAGALAVRQLTTMASGALDAANNLNDLSQSLGLTAERIQEYRFAALQVGIVQQQFDTNLERFVRRLGLAREGTGALADVAQELALDLSDTDRAFRQVIEAMGQAGDAADVARIADAAFGRFGIAMGRLATEGVAGFDQLAGRLRELGPILSNELAADAASLNSNLAALREAMRQAFDAGLLQELVGDADNLEEVFQRLIPIAAEWGQRLGSAITGVADKALLLVENLEIVAGLLIGLRIGAAFGGVGAIVGAAAGALAGFAVSLDTTTTATDAADGSLRRYGRTVQEVEANIAALSVRQRESAQIQAVAELADAVAEFERRTGEIREQLEVSFASTNEGSFEERTADFQRFQAQLESLYQTVRDGETPLADWVLAFADVAQISGDLRVQLSRMADEAQSSLGEVQRHEATLRALEQTATEADMALHGVAGGIQEVGESAAAATGRVVGFLNALPARSMPGLSFQDPMDLIGRSFDFDGEFEFSPITGTGGGATAAVSEQERLKDAYVETLAELDRQVFAQQNLVEAHGDTAAAVAAAEAHNRAYADAVRLGVAEDEAAVAAIEKRVIALQGLAQELDLARMAERGELDLAAAQDQFELIGLSGVALDQAEARLRVIQDLRERGIGLESDLAQQMIRTAEATATARSQAEFLSSAVGTAYQGLGQLATTAITNFEDLGRVAGQVLSRIAGMLVDFGTDQIFSLIFGSIISGVGAAAGGGAAGGSVSFGGLYHSGGLVGITAVPHRALSLADVVNAPRLHSGLTGLRPDEFAAVLQRGEEVLTERDPRHVRNLGSLPDVGPRGTGDNVVVQQTNHFARGMEQVARRMLLEMMPEIMEATTAGVIEARSRQPSIFEAPQ